MASVRTANLGLRFLLELGLLVGVGWWGEHAIGLWAAFVLPLAAAFLWGLFLSPKARWTIPAPGRFTLEFVLFALAAVGYWVECSSWVAVGFASAVALSEAVQWSGSSPPA